MGYEEVKSDTVVETKNGKVKIECGEVLIPVEDVTPYENNPKKHPEEQVELIAEEIERAGFDQQIIVDKNLEVVVGHGRLLASKKLGMDEIPAKIRDDFTEIDAKNRRIADNKVAESEWDEEKLKQEFKALEDAGEDLEDTGFGQEEIDMLLMESEKSDSNQYTDKIEAPTYTPDGVKPSLEALYDDERAKELIEKIEESNVEEDKKEFLIKTAYRHIVFDYEEIAEYYAHESEEVQELMEALTLVIIDYDKAVEQGFVNFAKDTLDGVGE